jgi:hypothetical protein
MLDYGQPTQSKLGTITAAEAARHLADGQFPPGSMGPKIEAALRFLAEGGELAVITSPDLLAASLTGGGAGSGTRIERSPDHAPAHAQAYAQAHAQTHAQAHAQAHGESRAEPGP